jgi:MFS family permease
VSEVSPYRDRSVVILLAVMFTGSVGVFAQATALGKLVYDISGRELDLGLLGLAEFLPAALLVLVTGAVADHFDRRRVAAAGLLGEGACAVALAVYAASSPTAVGPIFVIAFLYGVARAFAAPATRALPANVAPPGTLPKVTATNSAMWQAALIVGPVLGGLLYAIGATWPFVAAAALGAGASAAVGFIRLPPRAGARHGRGAGTEAGAGVEAGARRMDLASALDGLRFIRRTPILLAAISLDLFAVLFGGAVALLPAIAEERLGVGSVALGWLRASAGVGAVVVAVLLARRPLVRRVGRTLLSVVAVFGVATVVLGVTRSFVVAFVAIAVLSGADMVSVFIRSTLVPLATPDAVRGRVLAGENVFIGASNELGAFESGVAGEALGVSGAVVSGGLATLVVAVVWWFRFPVLRDLDRFADLPAHGPVAPDAARRPVPDGP